MLKSHGQISAACQSGQGLTEYTLLFCITVVVCYTGFALLFKTSELNLDKTGLSKTATIALLGSAAYAGDSQSKKAPPPPTLGQEQVCLLGNGCLHIPVIKAQSVGDTSGANGGRLTLAYSEVISQIAQQLQANPKQDPHVAQLVTSLARHGQSIGDKENDMATTCKAGAQCILPTNQLLDQVESIHQVAEQFRTNGIELDNYLSQNPKALSEPMRTLLHTQSTNISNIANSYQSAKLVVNTPDDQSAPLTQQWAITQDAKVSLQNASTICKEKGIAGTCLH